jgi:hypothetical protein
MRPCRALTVKLELKTAVIFTLKCKKNMPGWYRGKRLNLAGMTWHKEDSEFMWHR